MSRLYGPRNACRFAAASIDLTGKCGGWGYRHGGSCDGGRALSVERVRGNFLWGAASLAAAGTSVVASASSAARGEAIRRNLRRSVSVILVGFYFILNLVAAPPAFGGVIYDFTASSGNWTAEGSPVWSWAAGTGWSTDGNDGPAENFLVSPVFTVAETGQLHGTFGHSCDFENQMDGGVIEYKVNAGAWTYVNYPLVGLGVTQGYNTGIKAMPKPPNVILRPGSNYLPGFSGALGPVTTEFALGAGATADIFVPGDSIQIRFRGWWDVSDIATNPNWTITAASLNITSAAVPEIDPSGIGPALAIVTGAVGLLERRRKRA